MRPDLGAFGVLLGRDVTELFEKWHVDVGLDVAGDSRIAIPVPGSADVGGLIDQPHIVDAELLAPRTDQQPAEAGADDRDVDGVIDGFAAEVGIGPWIIAELAEGARYLHVLCNAVGA